MRKGESDKVFWQKDYNGQHSIYFRISKVIGNRLNIFYNMHVRVNMEVFVKDSSTLFRFRIN